MNCMARVVNCPKRAIGYEVTAGNRALLNAMTRKTPIVKLMDPPPGRKLSGGPVRPQAFDDDRGRLLRAGVLYILICIMK